MQPNDTSPPDAVAELIAKARDGAKFRFDKQSDRVRDLADALEDCRRDNATLNGQLKNHKGHIEYGIHQNNAAADRVMALEAEIAALKADRDQLRIRLLTAAGDDLCRLSQEEIKELSSGAVKIPPEDEFLASCKRFHGQIASTSGVLGECMTLAQMIAENERLKADLRSAQKTDDLLTNGIKVCDQCNGYRLHLTARQLDAAKIKAAEICASLSLPPLPEPPHADN